VGAAGIEPALSFNATGNLPCGCVICEECRAALALQTESLEWLAMALFDADLQRVIMVWDSLPTLIRNAILALARLQ